MHGLNSLLSMTKKEERTNKNNIPGDFSFSFLIDR